MVMMAMMKMMTEGSGKTTDKTRRDDVSVVKGEVNLFSGINFLKKLPLPQQGFTSSLRCSGWLNAFCRKSCEPFTLSNTGE